MSTHGDANPAGALLLHALWDGRRLHVFGTSADVRYPSAVASGAALIGMADTTTLHEALGRIASDALLATGASHASIKLWLPAGGVSSTEEAVGGTLTRVRASARFATATVPTLTFDAADSIDLLVGLDAGALGHHGDSLSYWARLANYGLSLLMRRKFCPDLHESGDGEFLATWRLLVHDADELAWLERMIAAMPPVCRAGVSRGDDAAATAAGLVESFLMTACDRAIRRCLAGDEFFRQLPNRARELDAWELHWLAALVAARPRNITGSQDDGAAGAARVHRWIAQADDDTTLPPVKLRMTLHEPATGDESERRPWRLTCDLLSQETGAPLDVARIWTERESSPTILGAHLASRREHLVSLLTRAAELCPELKRLRRGRTAAGLDLSTPDAHAFLRDRAPLLAAEGFEVVLPPWAKDIERSIGLQLVVSPRTTGGGEVSLGTVGLHALLDFDWRVAVGGEQVSLEDFERMARARAPLVRHRGQWVQIDPDAAERALSFMRSRSGGALSLIEAIRLAGGAEDADSGLPIVGLSGADWIDDLLRDTPETAVEAVDAPREFQGTLRPYQLRGLQWLAFLDRLGIGACLADDMGLGKTIQLLALLLHERQDAGSIGPTILFAPMSVVGNWEREIQRFAPSLRVLIFHGPERLGGDAFVSAAARHDVVLTTYGLAGREFETLSRVAWHRIAMDEAQNIKNPTARQTIALRSMNSPRKIALTGTPIENHLSELWSIMDVLNPGLLGSARAFRSRFALPVEKMGDSTRAGQLRRLIRPFVLRRLKSDPAVACDLPEKMEMRVYCNLTPEQAALYERTVRDMMDDIDQATGIRRRGLILAALTKLKQICNHPAHFLKTKGPLDSRSGKCERLVEMLEEVIEEGDCALVFTQYRKMGDLLEAHLRARLGLDVPFLHGGTPAKKRTRMVDDFQNPDGPHRVFLLSLKAGGFGLNLTRANHVFQYDRWWNPAVEQQAADRVHRIGQTRRVQVHKFVCIGTVEERIDRLLEEKAALADRIVGSGDDWLTGLSTVELREYLALSADAVSEN